MGFFDFFRRKEKVLMIKEKNNTIEQIHTYDTNENDTQSEINEQKIELKVFSKKTKNRIEYFIEMFSKEGIKVKIGKFSCLEDLNGLSILKNDLKELQDNILLIVTARNGFTLKKAKEITKQKLMEMNKEGIEFSLDGNIIEYIDNYELKQLLDYEKLEKLDRKIDISALGNEQVMQLGQNLEKRLNMLNEIRTPEDAYEDKDNLIYYMQLREHSLFNPIIDANIQSQQEGKSLDDDTTIRIARSMEQLNNEDGALYSVYLKIEEKRILKKVQTIFEEYCKTPNVNKNPDEINQLLEDVQSLEQYEIQDIESGFSPEILEYMINEIKEKDIEKYITTTKIKDMMLVKKISSDFEDIPEKIQILQFLHARIGSLGQLSKSSVYKNKVLRDYVANTDFKDEDNTESKEFLLLISKIEKEYIEKEYDEVIKLYMKQKNQEKNSKALFKERMITSTTPLKIKHKNINNSIDKEENTR